MPAHPRFPIAPDHDSNGPHDLLQRRSCWLHLLKLGGTVIGTVATGTVRHEAHPSHAGPLPDRVAGVLCVGRWRGLRDRNSVVMGNGVSVRLYLGCRMFHKKTN